MVDLQVAQFIKLDKSSNYNLGLSSFVGLDVVVAFMPLQ